MTISRRQKNVNFGTAAASVVVALPSPSKLSSTLIANIATNGGDGVVSVTSDGPAMFLPMSDDLSPGGTKADSEAGDGIRVQLWAAFNVGGGDTTITVTFDSPTTNSAVWVGEYTGNTFLFPEPCDVVLIADGFTANGAGVLDTTAGPSIREPEELWVAGTITTNFVLLEDENSPWSAVEGHSIAGGGRFNVFEGFSSEVITSRYRADHTASVANYWAVAMATVRGRDQAPFTGDPAPVVPEPVTENEDHEGSAIALLLEQFRSHDER